MISPFFSHKYYASRSQFLLDVSEGKFKRVSEVYVSFAKPDCGWIEMDVYIDGAKAHKICLSDAFDPMVDIRDWLTDIISGTQTIAQLSVNEEFSYSVLTFEEYGVEMSGSLLDRQIGVARYEMVSGKKSGDVEAFNNRTQLGLLTIYDTGSEDMPVKVIVSTRQLVAAIYLGLLTYAATYSHTQPEESFGWNWNSQNYVSEATMDDSQAQWDLYNLIKNPELEHFLFIQPAYRCNDRNISKTTAKIASYIIMRAELPDCLFWTNGVCYGNADKVFADNQWIDLTVVKGLREWYDEFCQRATDAEWERGGYDKWFAKGRALAFEIRRKLPQSVELFYYWLPFRHKIEGQPDIMNLIPNIQIK